MRMKKLFASLIAFILIFNISSISKADGDFDFDQAIIYFLLTDRFNNGDPSNDDPNGENYDKSHFETYHGGDFKGLIEKLDYLKELGVNTIWITPIVDNIDFNNRHGKDYQYGYHGYWAKDFTQIDEHLGNLDTFKQLIDEIHDRDMKLMVDVVINHTGYGMKETDQNPGIPNYPTDEERAVFEGMLRLEPGRGDIEGELAGLPDFISEDADVLNQVIAWQKDWIEKARTEKGNTIDYFRVDTVKHVRVEELKEFKDQVVEIEPNFKMIGEYFDGHIFNNGKVMELGGMDSVLDFEFKNIASKYTRGNFEAAEKDLKNRNFALSKDQTTGQFLSSHDEHGFLKMKLGGDEGLFKVASTIQLTAKGQPVIYYGEEIGMSGRNAGDMDQGQFSENRYDFDWSKVENNQMLDHYKALLKVRNENTEIFTEGERNSLFADKEAGVSVFERKLGDESIIVAVNISDQAKNIFIDTSLDKDTQLLDLYSGKEIKVSEDGNVILPISSKDDGGTAIIKADKNVDQVRLATQEDIDQADSQGGLFNSILPIIGVALFITVGFLFVAFATNRSKRDEII